MDIHRTLICLKGLLKVYGNGKVQTAFLVLKFRILGFPMVTKFLLCLFLWSFKKVPLKKIFLWNGYLEHLHCVVLKFGSGDFFFHFKACGFLWALTLASNIVSQGGLSWACGHSKLICLSVLWLSAVCFSAFRTKWNVENFWRLFFSIIVNVAYPFPLSFALNEGGMNCLRA